MILARPQLVRAVVGQRAFSTSFRRASGKVVEVTDSTFDKVVAKADNPVIVDFHADWCGPCKVIKPLLTKTVAAYPNVTLATLNVDDNQETAAQYKIAALPTVAAFHKGKVVDQFVGVRKPDALEAFVKKHASLD